MSLTLFKAITQCPRSLFGDKDKGIPPKFRKIFALVAKALLTDAGEKFSEKTIDLVADAINVSSMQRAVAGHRKFLEEGGVKPPKKERGKTRPKADEDELGLGSSKKAGKKPKAKATKPGKTAKKADKPAKKTAPDKEAPAKAASEPAKAPKSEKPKEVKSPKLDALAAARASLAAKKAAKAGKPAASAKPAEESVEI